MEGTKTDKMHPSTVLYLESLGSSLASTERVHAHGKGRYASPLVRVVINGSNSTESTTAHALARIMHKRKCHSI